MTDNATFGACAEMPRYQCHKQVWALKIASIDGCKITPADAGYASFEVDPKLYLRYTPVAGDFYVVYDDGYKSFSPAAAFEGGYRKCHTFKDRLAIERDDLAERGAKLAEYIAGDTFGDRSPREQEQLRAQLVAMTDYLEVLSERIGDLSVQPPIDNAHVAPGCEQFGEASGPVSA